MQIDFAASGVRRSLYRLHPALGAAAVLGLLLCVGAAVGGWKLLEQQRERERQLRHQMERYTRLAAAPAPVARTVIPQAQAVFVNAAIGQLNLPWRELMDAVAAATPRSVALLALEPDARKQVLKITAEARGSDEMVAYIEELKQQDVFSSVLLTRHEIGEQDPNHPLRFQLEAAWSAR
ncbi:PilN domain-containing protein [Oxalobacteraceae bacterium A2-2]